tara:strand:+ start:885 stop:1292 length:408 start_codon:yes stop_codon:yes gene_type:complete
MATSTSKRTYPNDYFAWYNDDNRIGIVNKVTSTDDNEGFKSGEYDTYSDSTVTAGLKIHYHSKYPIVDKIDDDLYKDIKLDSGLHPAIVCYLKARLFEDVGDIQKSQYFRVMYEKMMKQYPSRKSGVRSLAVPRL